MNPEKNTTAASASGDICPVTGLPVIRKPEWTYSGIGEGHRITVEVIGDNIIHTRNSGYATLPDVENAVSLTDSVVNEAIANRRPYVHILDYSNFKGAALDGRKYFITRVKDHKQECKGMIFFGASLLFNISINLARRLNVVSFDVHIVKDYSEAVKLALEILHAFEIERDVCPTITGLSKPLTDEPGKPTREIITQDDWSIETGNYSAHYEVIDGDILHGVSTGVFEENHVEPLGNLREKVITSELMPHVSYYSVIGVGAIEKTSLRARRLFMESVKEWYKKYPFQMIILYGESRMIRAAFNLGRHFLPFDARMVNTLEEALELIAGEKTTRKENEPLPAVKDTAAEPAASEQIQQYVDELLRFVGGIPWNSEGFNRDRSIGPSHPLSPVFDTIELIKADIDELLQERTATEKELRESNDRYRALFDNNPIETMIVNRKGIITGYNLAKERSGSRLPDINNDVMYKDYAAKHNINMFEELMECIASGTSKEFPDQLYKNKFLDIRIAPFSEGAIITSINVTERKQQEDVIRGSRQRLADIINFLPDATFAINLEGTVVIWNRAIEKMTGFKAKDMLGKGNYEYALPFYGTRRPILIDLILDYDRGIEKKYSFIHREGDTLLTEGAVPFIDGRNLFLWAKASPLHDLQGNVVGAIESIRDITDRKRAIKKLQESEARYRAVFENTGTATAIIEDDTTISMANAKFEILSGYSREELEGKMRWTAFVVEEDLKSMKESHKKRRENGEGAPREYEFRFVDRQGNIRNIFLMVDMIPGTKRSVCSLMDITALRKSSEEKEVLLKEIHHRVKNNMQVISSLLGLQAEYVKDKESSELFRESEDRIRAMASVHEMLYQAGDLTRIDAADYVQSMAQQLAAAYSVDPAVVRININCSDVSLSIEKAVPCGLIINELISNALKHAFPEGREGNITVELRFNKEIKEFTLRVIDDGIGLPEDIDFRNTTTFGLHLVSILAEQLDAVIELDRSGGTSFRITFRKQQYKRRI